MYLKRAERSFLNNCLTLCMYIRTLYYGYRARYTKRNYKFEYTPKKVGTAEYRIKCGLHASISGRV